MRRASPRRRSQEILRPFTRGNHDRSSIGASSPPHHGQQGAVVKTRSFMVAAASALALVLAVTGVAFAASSIRGGGATFSAPFWQQVGADYQKKSGNTV